MLLFIIVFNSVVQSAGPQLVGAGSLLLCLSGEV